jgi:HEAT repeat protein
MKKRLFACLAIAVAAAIGLIFVAPQMYSPVLQTLSGQPYINGRSLSRWIEDLNDPNPEVRKEAISNIGDLRAEAAAALPRLNEIARHDHISLRTWAISNGLGRIGAAGVPALRELLSDPTVRTVTVIAIGEMGPAAEAAVPDLIKILDDNRPLTRMMACESLAKIGPAARGAIPALTKKLQDEHGGVRRDARDALDCIEGRSSVYPPRVPGIR